MISSSENPQEFSNKVQGAFEKCDEDGYQRLEKIIGQPAIDYIRNDPNLTLYKRVKIPIKHLTRRDDLFILKAYERAVLLAVRNDINTGVFKNLEINFTFWQRLMKKGETGYRETESSLRKDTLTFLKTIYGLLIEIDDNCPVEFSGVDEQRDRIWETAINKLKKLGKNNIRMKEKIVIRINK